MKAPGSASNAPGLTHKEVIPVNANTVKLCDQCGNEFRGKYPSSVAARRFCSRACMGIACRATARDPHRTAARFWAMVDKNGPDGIHSQTGANLGPCWLWTGSKNASGYGMWMETRGGANLVHRWAYRDRFGHLPEKPAELDHLCRTHACCNPDHLESVTRLENVARGNVARSNALRGSLTTQCRQGHAFDEANTAFTSRGWRRCRRCHREQASAARVLRNPFRGSFRGAT